MFFLIVIIFSFVSGPGFCSQDDLVEQASSLWWTGNYSLAIDKYEEAAINKNSEFISRVNLGALYRSVGDYSSAIQQYRYLLSTASLQDMETVQLVYLPLAHACYYSNRLSEAEQYFRSILAVFPDSPQALFGLGRTLFSKDKLEEAQKIFHRAVKVDPRFPGNYIYLGRIAHNKNQDEKAAEYYRSALKKDSHQVELRYFLGENYQSRGLNELAYKQFHRLENVDSNNSFVQEKIEGILPALARKPEEIVTAKALNRFSPLRVVEASEEVPILKIGINTSHQGRFIPTESVTFTCNQRFDIVSEDKNIFSGEENKNYTIAFNKGKPTIVIEESGVKYMLPEIFTIQPKDLSQGAIILRGIEYARGFAWAGKEDRQYRGILHVHAERHGFKMINEVNLEEYLYSVVPSEMMISFPKEALEAQAVIARTYALYRRKYLRPHARAGFDLCDSQHCQVYKGVSNEWRKTNRAIDSTRAQALYHKKRMTHPLFHSNCGGHTQSSKDLKGWYGNDYLTGTVDGPKEVRFPSSPSELEGWLKSRPSVYCNIPKYGWDPEFRWFRIVSTRFIEERINRSKKIGKIKKITVTRRSPSGNIYSLIVTGTKSELIIDREHRIRRLMGIGPMRSTLFWIETKYDTHGYPEEFIFYGGGWGHGVGLCQSGAAGMAQKGATYKEILSHYYKDTYIKKLKY